jgi:hypothetical protein
MMACKHYFKLSGWKAGMMDCQQAIVPAVLHAVMLSYWQASKTDCLSDGMTASWMSCLQASLQDGKPDVMQAGMKAGRHDGWHCIHCEYCMCGAQGRGL